MAAKKIKIHQFSPSVAVGDGVTTGLFFTRKLLRELGFESHIYAAGIPSALTQQVLPIKQFDHKQTDLFLVHHSMGHDHDQIIKKTSCPMVIIYHNITPEHYFKHDSGEYRYSIKGRQQLRDWKDRFIGAIGISPYNSEELSQAGYANIITLPMLIDLDKFGLNQPECPDTSSLDPFRSLIISVGRIVENKRQHLLIKAYWQLKQLMPKEQLPQLVIVGGATSPNYELALKHYIAQLGLQDDVLMLGKCSDQQLAWLYQNADCYWCASEHEGFCMPLIEAGFFSIPVVSFATSNIPATLGESGLIVEQSEPEQMAAVTKILLEDELLKQQLIAAGKKNLDRFRLETLKPQFKDYLAKLAPTLVID